MAGGIDTSQRKPRQLRGTPAYKFGNRLAGAVVTFGVVCGLVINQFDLIGSVKQLYGIDLLHVSDEEKDRRGLLQFSLFKPKTGGTLSKLLEEQERLQQER